MMSGVRWVFTQLLLHKNHDEGSRKNPIFTIYQLSPPMFLALFAVGCGVEGFGNFIHADIWSEKGVFKSICLLLLPGFMVLFMTLFEFGILQRAQVVTLSIAGIFKELLTIVASTFIFHDRLTFINLIGLVITLVDIVWYNVYRYNEKKEEYNSAEFELDRV
jgi:solute carrier family 35 protein C2